MINDLYLKYLKEREGLEAIVREHGFVFYRIYKNAQGNMECFGSEK